MQTILNKNTGELLYTTVVAVDLQKNEIAVNDLLNESFVRPFYNFETNTFYEGATQSEIEEYNIIETPQEVQLWRIRTVLKLMNLEETVEIALNNLEEPTKTGALYIWNYGTTVERYSQTVLMLQMALQMTNEQVNQMFVQANNIQL